MSIIIGLKKATSGLMNSIGRAVQSVTGKSEKIPSSELVSEIEAIPLPATLPVESFTARKTASSTSNVACNDNIRFLGSDGNKYTIREWNAIFVAAGYNKDNMDVTPVGLAVDAMEHSGESYLFDRFLGNIYNPVGDSAGGEGRLSHSIYNHNLVTGTGSGTDSVTNKGWSVTESGGNLVLHEDNTGQSWTMAKDCGGVYAHKAYNIADRTHSLWAQTEWLRHRFAISSGVATTATDGTMGEVGIFNSSGNQAAANEDMYFYVRATSSDAWQATGKLAKYNLNNRHTVSGYSLTQAIADAIYARQKANGINMNDTGVNSASKPVLAPGSKGAEAIAVGGYWYIITPYISNPNATTGTATNNMADSPAVYWAKYKGYSLPSDTLIWALYANKDIVNSMISYLTSVEGRTIPTIPTGDYIWSAVRLTATSAWNVNFNYGYWSYNITFNRYFVAGASAS